jgi:hypothetical protein
LTDAFSDDEKNEFTTKQENVSQDEVEKERTCRPMFQWSFQEGRMILNEKTGQQGQGIIEGLMGNSHRRING